MEQLKKVLRQALSDGAQRIRLQDGAPVDLLLAQGATGTLDQLSVTTVWLEHLFSFLFAQDKGAIQQLSQGQPTKGALNIPGVGKILLLALPQKPASLRLYLPPEGSALFESDWSRLASRTTAPTPPAIPLPPEAPRSPAAMGLAAPQYASAAPGAASNGIEGFVPAGFEAPAVSAFHGAQDQKNQAVQAAEAAATPKLAPLPPPDSDEPPMFATPIFSSGTRREPPPSLAPFAPPTAMQNDTGMVSPVALMPPVAAKTTEEKPGQIAYDVDAGAKGSLSFGENPVDAILTEMVGKKASDLHLTTGQPVCMRVDGEITRMRGELLAAADMAKLLDPLFPARNRKEFLEGNDTDFAYELSGVGRFRVNIFRDRNGVGSVMRHIPSKILTAEQLNLPPVVTKFTQLSKGLVVVTGPTGSGKSTTLAAMVDLINKSRSDHILTIEDPIEFVHPQQRCLVNQREVFRHTTSFSRALRAALREDPDIVLIGEMRDLETVAIAIETAETGHLVFGTLHTTTAISTVDRIIDQFPTTQQEQIRMMLASSLKGVVAQTLLKKKGGGRVAALEILVINDAVSAMIREGKNHMIAGHMQSQKADGNQLLNEALAKLVKDNVVELDEAFRKSVDKSGFIELLKRLGIKLPAIAAGSEKPVGSPSSQGKQSA